MARVLLDTGPLVALFKRNDAWHRRAVGWFSRTTIDLGDFGVYRTEGRKALRLVF